MLRCETREYVSSMCTSRYIVVKRIQKVEKDVYECEAKKKKNPRTNDEIYDFRNRRVYLKKWRLKILASSVRRVIGIRYDKLQQITVHKM